MQLNYGLQVSAVFNSPTCHTGGKAGIPHGGPRRSARRSPRAWARERLPPTSRGPHLEDVRDVAVVVLVLLLVEFLKNRRVVCFAVLSHLVPQLRLLPGLGAQSRTLSQTQAWHSPRGPSLASVSGRGGSELERTLVKEVLRLMEAPQAV